MFLKCYFLAVKVTDQRDRKVVCSTEIKQQCFSLWEGILKIFIFNILLGTTSFSFLFLF